MEWVRLLKLESFDGLLYREDNGYRFKLGSTVTPNFFKQKFSRAPLLDDPGNAPGDDHRNIRFCAAAVLLLWPFALASYRMRSPVIRNLEASWLES